MNEGSFPGIGDCLLDLPFRGGTKKQDAGDREIGCRSLSPASRVPPKVGRVPKSSFQTAVQYRGFPASLLSFQTLLMVRFRILRLICFYSQPAGNLNRPLSCQREPPKTSATLY